VNVRNTTVGAVASAAAIAAAIVAATGTSAIAGASPNHYRSLTAAAPQVAGKSGWQGEYSYTVPTGATTLQFHYPCPSGLYAESGAFQDVAPGRSDKGAMDFHLWGWPALVWNAPNYGVNYGEWIWDFMWPNGLQSGESINFDVYCTKVR